MSLNSGVISLNEMAIHVRSFWRAYGQ